VKVVLETATGMGESGYRPRDVEIVGVKFCEFEWDGWLSVWMTDVDGGEMPVQRWLIDNKPETEQVRVWNVQDDDVLPGNWVYSCHRVSIIGDD
jgi:hypothetical protein